MNDRVRRPFWLALAASLMLHAAMLASPGWGLPFSEDEPGATLLDAQLAIPQAARTATPLPAAKPPPRPRPPPAPKAAPAPVENAVAMPQPDPAPVTSEPAVAAEVAQPDPPLRTVTYADSFPRNGRIVFQVTRGESGLIVGQAEHRWQHDGENYQLRAVTETIGLAALFRPAQVAQESRGRFIASGLQPLEFRVERDGKPKESALFEPASGNIRFGGGNSAPFVNGMQDLLSLFYQLGAVPTDAPRFTVSVTTGRKLATFTVTQLATETLDTPFGERPAQHLAISGGNAEENTEVWLDTASRLPLKIRYRDRKGEIFDQKIMALELDKTP